MANPDLAPGALAKPSRLDRDVAKHKRRVTRSKAKRAAEKVENDAWMALRETIFTRDLGLCRFCDRAVHLRHVDPEKVAHCHHLVYRSAGGANTSQNLITLCARCHEAEHKHHIDIMGDGDGDLFVWTASGGNQQLKFPRPAVDARRA